MAPCDGSSSHRACGASASRVGAGGDGVRVDDDRRAVALTQLAGQADELESIAHLAQAAHDARCEAVLELDGRRAIAARSAEAARDEKARQFERVLRVELLVDH